MGGHLYFYIVNMPNSGGARAPCAPPVPAPLLYTTRKYPRNVYFLASLQGQGKGLELTVQKNLIPKISSQQI